MSAHVVSKAHVDLLVRAADHYGREESRIVGSRFRWWKPDEDGDFSGVWYELDPFAESNPADESWLERLTPSQTGQLLVSECVASVHHRYPNDDPDAGELPGPVDAYYIAPYVYADPGRILTPGEVFKALDYFEYQSCEHPEWRASAAYSFCDFLRRAACRAVPGYETAPYGFDTVEEGVR